MQEEFDNTLDKLQELFDLLSNYKYELHYRDDCEYEYLEEGSVCITCLLYTSWAFRQ